ncbi:alpha/beta hydrolase [uncultured Williamsia sp.]|uniref:alpha/beta hydrolase n=1 Tax=uncultured Williamsia sp. TaxID=259311 RepID=UPI002638F3FC|nr:alpha/beta hydrolase [uncultured Williamsia sp.]
MTAGPKTLALPIGLVEPVTRALYALMLHPRMPVGWQRAMADHALDVDPLPADTVVRTITLGGRPTERVTVGATENSTAVLYLHGGGYVMGSPRSHRRLTARLAAVTDATVFAPDYRLAPEDPFPAALDDGVAAFLDLVHFHGFRPDQIAVAGDSAGGGLSVAVTRRLIDHHEMTPAAMGLIAPWVDPSIDTGLAGHATDVIVNHPWSRACAAAYLADGDASDPGYAPLNGDLSGLPPTVVHIGEREALHPQVLTFVDKARAAGVDVDLEEFPRLWHVGHLQASMLAEASDAVDHLGGFLRARLA